MKFTRHSQLEGTHAFLSASKYSWLRYSDDQLVDTYAKHVAAALGTRLHALANELIELGIRLPRTNATLNRFVNDCISMRMESEVVLFYSLNAFGTADAIKFDERSRKLYVFDLKTGVTKASFDQLMIYAALFCLEYGRDPADFDVVLRIYQNDDVLQFEPETEVIRDIMAKVIRFDQLIETCRSENDWLSR